MGILRDAAEAHDNAPPAMAGTVPHAEVSMLINRIIDGDTSARRR